MAAIVLALIGMAFLGYGLSVLAVQSGTLFYAVWLVAGGALITCALLLRAGILQAVPALVRYVACTLAGLVLLAIVVAGGLATTQMGARAEPGMDYLVVLGAQVREDGPSTVLRYRLDRAIDYLGESPETIVIVSGGQGPNEPWTEAKGMATYLVAHGVDESRILLEDQSTTTVENVENSMALIDSPHDARVGIVTNDFHVYRAVRIARAQGLANAEGIAAHSDAWYIPNNLLRESLGIIKDAVSGNL